MIIMKNGFNEMKRQVKIRELFLDSEIYVKIYQPDSDGNGSAVILSHGYNCAHDNVEDVAQVLAEKGYFCCTFDFCGGSTRSKSVGKTTEMSIGSEVEELNRIIGFVKADSGAEKLFLYGESQGGLVSSLAACCNDIEAMVLLYPGFCIPDDWRNSPYAKSEQPFEFMGMTISKSYCEGLPDYDVFDRISHCDIPVLIIHGTDDDIVNVSYAQKAEKCFPNAVLKLYDGEGHGFSAEARRSEICDTAEFFDKYGGA